MAEKKKLTGLNEFLFPKPPEEFDFRDLMPEYYEYYAEKHTGEKGYEELLSALKKMKNETDPVEKWYLYKTLGTAPEYKNCGLPFDCDNSNTTCQLAAEIYKALWSKKKHTFCKNRGTLAGETMNSVLTTLNELGKQEKLGEMSKNNWINLHQNKFLLFQRFFEANPQAVEFIRVAHTIGNFTIWPSGCNGPRGFNNREIEDYWDLTLWNIYCWYKDKSDKRPDDESDEHLKRIVNGKFQKLRKWLELFQDEKGNPSWDIFVEKNYLQDYTEWTTSPYGRPKEFWDGHFSGKALPQTPEQIEAFFVHATECIKARSKRMVDALRERSKNQ